MGNQAEVTSYVVSVWDVLPKEYENLVFTKWSRSYRYGNDYIKLIDSDAYYTVYRRLVLQTLSKARVRVATLSDDIDVVLGFCVYRGNILDYIYVHKDCRGRGIGKMLLPKGLDTFTHLTRRGMLWWTRRYPGARFNPFA